MLHCHKQELVTVDTKELPEFDWDLFVTAVTSQQKELVTHNYDSGYVQKGCNECNACNEEKEQLRIAFSILATADDGELVDALDWIAIALQGGHIEPSQPTVGESVGWPVRKHFASSLYTAISTVGVASRGGLELLLMSFSIPCLIRYYNAMSSSITSLRLSNVEKNLNSYWRM